MRRPESELPLVQAASNAALRRVLLLAILAVSALGIWASAAGIASAEQRHLTPASAFGPDGTGATSFGDVKSLAYQQASDRLFVLDAAGGIAGFDRSVPGASTPLGGAFPVAIPALGAEPDLAVDNSAGSTAGNLYLAPDGPTISSYGSNGALLPTTYNGDNSICGVAIDNTGHIWAGRRLNGSVLEFTPGSATISRTLEVFNAALPCKVAFDPITNDLYVSSTMELGIWRYTAASNYGSASEIYGTFALRDTHIVVNGAKHVLYIGSANSGGKIQAFNTVTGTLLETVELPSPAIRGLEVDEETDTLLVAMGDTNKVLEIPAVSAPKATTGEPIGNAKVGGTVDPDDAGPITECYFEFGLTAAYGSKQNCTQSLPINAPTTVTADLPGLVREKANHYRLVVATATPGTVVKGEDREIRPRHVQGIKPLPASEISRTAAMLNASFEGTNEETTYYIEYGSQFDQLDQYLRFPVAPNREVVAPSTGLATISVPVSGLTASTFYIYRVIAENSQGVSVSDEGYFYTLPAVDAVVTEAATDVTKSAAVLHGSYDGATNDTPPGPLENFRYYFEWGPTEAYGNKTAVPPGESGGAYAGTVHVSAPISGLQVHLPASQPYHYRLVVSNSTGTTYGSDMSFTTLPPDKPRVRDVRAEAIQSTSATVAATINPGSAGTTYRVQYGPSSKYDNTTPERALAADESDQPISVSLGQLARGTVYHYRVLATNSSGTTASPDQTFTTPSVPVIDSSEASAGATTARLTVAVVANARPTEVRFEYGANGSFGSVTAPTPVAASLLAQTVSVELSGLQPGTTYGFRGLAVNEIGPATGPSQTFTTQPAPAPVPAAKAKPKKCKRAFVKRKGKCVKKKGKKRSGKNRKRGQAPSGGRR